MTETYPKVGDEVRVEPHSFTSFIQCDCQYCGGLMVNGIEVGYHRHEFGGNYKSAHVYFSIIRKRGMACEMTSWDRIKLMWDILRGKEEAQIIVDDIVLSKEGIEKLAATCAIALDNWPTKEELDAPDPTLEELFKSFKCDK